MFKYVCKENKTPYITDQKGKKIKGAVIIESETKLTQPAFIGGELVENPAQFVKALYDEMVVDVYAQMKTVFGTDNDVSASAFAATWEAMIKRPQNYVDEDLGFSTESEVLAFANAKIDSADAYGVFRMKRITEYQIAKAAL